MDKGPTFNGFSRETVAFLIGLRKNNNRQWFETMRPVYEAHLIEPAKAFVLAMGARLRSIVPRMIAIPKVNKSLFRINRDTRFSLDPSPYKTNLGIYFWEGTRPRMECPGFYFHLEPPHLMLGGGFYMFPDRLLYHYRKAVVDPKLGGELLKIVADLRQIRGLTLGGRHYKRVPAGFSVSHPNASLLMHKGLYAGLEMDIPEEFFSARLVDYCFERYVAFVPLHRWLVKGLGQY